MKKNDIALPNEIEEILNDAIEEAILDAKKRQRGVVLSACETPEIVDDMFIWQSEPPDSDAGSITVADIDHFAARGMRHVYGRADHYGRGRTFQMDIWKTKAGRLFMRCWSRNSEYCSASFEILGVTPPEIEKGEDGVPIYREYWVPNVVREKYDEWARGEF